MAHSCNYCQLWLGWVVFQVSIGLYHLCGALAGAFGLTWLCSLCLIFQESYSEDVLVDKAVVQDGSMQTIFRYLLISGELLSHQPYLFTWPSPESVWDGNHEREEI